MNESESPARILLVSFGVALFCSLLVATAVYWLRPLQAAHQSLEQLRAVLVTAQLVAADEVLTETDVVRRFTEVQTQLVDLDTGRVVESDSVIAGLYDYRAAADDAEQTVAIPESEDSAGLGRRPRVMPVYRLRGDLETAVVIPVYGPGMWSTIHGFIAFAPDFATITGVSFYELGETAGIGDRIQRPEWQATWAGKKAYRDDGSVGLRVGADRGDADDAQRIDSITGATVTVSAVDRFVRYWLGPNAWGTVLANLRGGGR